MYYGAKQYIDECGRRHPFVLAIETQCKEAEHKEKMKIAGNPLRDEGQGAIAALVFSPTEGRQQEQRRSEREETNS